MTNDKKRKPLTKEQKQKAREHTCQYRLNHPEKQKEWSHNFYLKNKDNINEKRRKNKDGIRPHVYKNITCNLIKKHHEEMKDDPEHLTTEFMQKLIGIKCKPKRINVTHDN